MLSLHSTGMPACRRACGAPGSSGRAPAPSPPPATTSRAIAAADGARLLRCRRPISSCLRPRAAPETTEAGASAPDQQPQPSQQQQPTSARSLVDRVTGGLGDTLGPIGLTFGGDADERGPAARKAAEQQQQQQRQQQQQQSPGGGGGLGVALGPISLSFGGDGGSGSGSASASAAAAAALASEEDASTPPQSIARLTTAEWRERFEREDGTVDLWLEDEFNAGSRLVGGRAVHWGGVAGFGSGEGPTAGDVPLHRVVIRDPHYGNATFDIEVPEDRYVLFEAEAQGLSLPYACRMGCCTACAVRVIEGELVQPQALGVSAELRAQGYALMCVAYPTSDCVVETVSEDEIYEKQFGEAFAQQALDPSNAAFVARDDFALEVALGDE